MTDPPGRIDGVLPTGPGPMRDWFRQGLSGPAEIRAVLLKWATARAKAGPEFAIPADWWPKGDTGRSQ